MTLGGLPPDAALEYCKGIGVEGPDAEVLQLCKRLGFHPLIVGVLAGVLHSDPWFEGDIRRADLAMARGSVHEEHVRILRWADARLTERERAFLFRLSTLRSDFGTAELELVAGLTPGLMGPDDSPQQLAEPVLRSLVARNLVQGDGS